MAGPSIPSIDSITQDVIDTIKEQTKPKAQGDRGAAKDTLNRADFFRIPFTMTTMARNAQNKTKKLAFRCNPSDVSISFPQRGGTQEVKNGKVFYYWRNPTKGSHFDLPAFTYTFQTGNIRPFIVNNMGADKNDSEVYVPEGLSNFYEWMSIYDEPKILADGSPNFVIIEHHSSIFPSLILQGFFEPGSLQEINEKSDESPTFSWQAKFLVHFSEPSINSDAFQNRFKSVFKEFMDSVVKASR